MVEKDEGLPYDSRKQTNRTVCAVATVLEVSEAAELKGFQLGV